MTSHRLVALAAAVVVAAGVAAVPTPAAAAPCPAGGGVTAVVDPGSLGGSVASVCVADGGGEVAWDIFEAGGFALTGVHKFPGFVCRVDGRPADDPCVNTPPADAYWGLFWSRGNGAWTYSSSGAMSLKLPEGGYVAVAWQDGGDRDLPGITPEAPVPPAPTKKPDPKPTKKPDPQPGPGTPPDAPSPSGSTSSPSATGSPTKTAAGSPGDQPSDQPGGPPSDQPSPTAEPTDDAGATGSLPEATSTSASAQDSDSGPGRWVPIAVIVALLGAAGLLVLRRRAP